MNYVSTRGRAPVLPFDEVLLVGLAADGGLYVPETWPRFSPDDIRAMGGLSYASLAARVMAPFVGDCLSAAELAALSEDSYGGFDHEDVAPMRALGADEWLLELFHGPTLAFKDFALQFLGRVFDLVLSRRERRATIVVATSGDTGSAAIEAFRDRSSVDIFVLHPRGRVSEVQRRQMTTVAAPNVHNIAIEGTFDDCQDLLKAMFNDTQFRDRVGLSAVNSINWARIVAQIVYYYWAAAMRGAPDQVVAFAVPSGNFGNVFAGYAAQRTGLGIERLVVGSNSNDILTRFFDSGRMEVRPVSPTISPSMDIQISSNFERLLFELHGRDGARVAADLERFRAEGAFAVPGAALDEARVLFDGQRFDDRETRDTIGAVYQDTGELVDPHTAVGIAAGRRRRCRAGVPMIALATAHPAKFPEAVFEATGVEPALPARLADLFERQERCHVLDRDLAALEALIGEIVAADGDGG